LEPGDVMIKLSAGGAGVGDPHQRDPELVRADVVEEMVTLEAAERIYGVVLDPRTLTVDRERTAALRAVAAEPAVIAIDERLLETVLRQNTGDAMLLRKPRTSEER